MNEYILAIVLQICFFEFSMIATIRWEEGFLKILDQTLLPHSEQYIRITHLNDLIFAIKTLQIRGAPALGIAGAFGMYLGLREIHANSRKDFLQQTDRIAVQISDSRPTAVNLKWATDKISRIISQSEAPLNELKSIGLSAAKKMLEEDIQSCQSIAENGVKLIPASASILTHCNAGGLATGGVGTALGILIHAHHLGKKIHVYVDETRPLLQGARLTTWELEKEKMDYTLICDSMAGYLMQQGKIQCALVGADRIAANGDTANKIGTYSIAVLCEKHAIPFYVAAPISTIDPAVKTGKEIPIENRDGREVKEILGNAVSPKNSRVYNPAFDVTPASLITAIITDKEIFNGPHYRLVDILN